MSLSAPPNQQQSLPPPQPAPPLTLKARLKNESRHWADMPATRFGLLVLPICVLVYLDPPLPFVAYTLWLWASSSWAWRDRWASIGALARRGGVFVGVVLLYAVLSSAQVWILPQLTATLRAFWLAHLPGDLSLSPLDPSLVARILLLLPLAPALALYFERIDPRTRVQHRRILTPRDLVEPKPKAQPAAEPTAQEAEPQQLTARAKPKPTAKAAPRGPAKQHSESPPPEQITIESYLTSDKDKAQVRPAPPSRPPAKKQKAEKVETPPPAPAKQIDWNDVAE